MNTNHGPIVPILIFLAIAAGCQKKPQSTQPRTVGLETATHAPDHDEPQSTLAVDAPKAPVTPVEDAVDQAPSQPAESPSDLARAKHDLAELGSDVSSLRSALLDVQFTQGDRSSVEEPDNDQR